MLDYHQHISGCIEDLDTADHLITNGSLPIQKVTTEGLESTEAQIDLAHETAIGLITKVERKLYQLKEELMGFYDPDEGGE